MADESRRFEIRFEDLSLADAGIKAADLRETLLDASPDVNVDLKKSDATTMDFGATLVLVLGTPAVLAIAKGISAYLAREREGTLVIEENGRVVFRGNSSDAAKIAASLGQKA
jgi:hypothetical protein